MRHLHNAVFQQSAALASCCFLALAFLIASPQELHASEKPEDITFELDQVGSTVVLRKLSKGLRDLGAHNGNLFFKWEKGLICLDAKSFKLRWYAPDVIPSGVVAFVPGPDHIYILRDGKSLTGLSIANGETSALTLSSPMEFPTFPRRGWVDSSGKVLVVHGQKSQKIEGKSVLVEGYAAYNLSDGKQLWEKTIRGSRMRRPPFQHQDSLILFTLSRKKPEGATEYGTYSSRVDALDFKTGSLSKLAFFVDKPLEDDLAGKSISYWGHAAARIWNRFEPPILPDGRVLFGCAPSMGMQQLTLDLKTGDFKIEHKLPCGIVLNRRDVIEHGLFIMRAPSVIRCEPLTGAVTWATSLRNISSRNDASAYRGHVYFPDRTYIYGGGFFNLTPQEPNKEDQALQKMKKKLLALVMKNGLDADSQVALQTTLLAGADARQVLLQMEDALPKTEEYTKQRFRLLFSYQQCALDTDPAMPKVKAALQSLCGYRWSVPGIPLTDEHGKPTGSSSYIFQMPRSSDATDIPFGSAYAVAPQSGEIRWQTDGVFDRDMIFHRHAFSVAGENLTYVKYTPRAPREENYKLASLDLQTGNLRPLQPAGHVVPGGTELRMYNDREVPVSSQDFVVSFVEKGALIQFLLRALGPQNDS